MIISLVEGYRIEPGKKLLSVCKFNVDNTNIVFKNSLINKNIHGFGRNNGKF